MKSKTTAELVASRFMVSPNKNPVGSYSPPNQANTPYAEKCIADHSSTSTTPTRHFDRSKPTPFPFTFAPANVSACAVRNLSSSFVCLTELDETSLVSFFFRVVLTFNIQLPTGNSRFPYGIIFLSPHPTRHSALTTSQNNGHLFLAAFLSATRLKRRRLQFRYVACASFRACFLDGTWKKCSGGA